METANIQIPKWNEDGPRAFHNDKAPNVTIQRENHRHRLMIYMAASGATQREIAQRFDSDDAYVSQILRQPWARDLLHQLQHSAGMTEIQAILKPAATDSLLEVIDISKDSKVKTETRLKAHEYIIDRYLGKPTQPVEEIQRDLSKLTDEELEKIASSGGVSKRPSNVVEIQDNGTAN